MIHGHMLGGLCAARVLGVSDLDASEVSWAVHEPVVDSLGEPAGSPIVGMHVYVCRHCRCIYCPETIGEEAERLAVLTRIR